ncbi:cytochrome c oxidase assembly protein [Chitinophaga japonensis]|uniref:Putative membrane protein n=1 Tax=Chitinophaga japonensis TaxID=104662 RepID=A0A562ST89_CHIJA|nr:cytochrome c oxidase assembly protein [Chitinophaga japonensis]TWI84461.1 putative membrane protein [Chitinophaga japonensis]
MNHTISFWSIDGTAAVVIAALALLYGLCGGFRRNPRMKYAAVAGALLLLCLCSPLQVLSAHYLFSAHMTVHVILLLLVGPLLLLGWPRVTAQSLPDRLFAWLRRNPAAAWIIGMGVMWCWHVPVIFNSSMDGMHHPGGVHWVHVAETFSLVLGGMVYSAPVLHPDPRYRMHALSGVVYLFTACTGCSILGLLITFAPAGTYMHYLSAADAYGLNAVIQQQWQLTRKADQQAAGLIMWVPCCFIYISGAIYLMAGWFGSREPASAVKNIAS